MYLKLTKISERDRNTLITLDNIVRGILADRILLPFFPVPFQGEISPTQADELLSLVHNQAKEMLLKYVSDREHSSMQCRDYLSRKRFPAELVSSLIQVFTELKYIDDSRFASMLISSLIERGKSKRAIMTKLKETRLPSAIWENALEELFSPAESRESLQEQMLKLLLRYAELPRAKQKEKIFTSLYRKGYDLDDIHSAWEAGIRK